MSDLLAFSIKFANYLTSLGRSTAYPSIDDDSKMALVRIVSPIGTPYDEYLIVECPENAVGQTFFSIGNIVAFSDDINQNEAIDPTIPIPQWTKYLVTRQLRGVSF